MGPHVDDVETVAVDVAVDQETGARPSFVDLGVVDTAECQVVKSLSTLVEESSTASPRKDVVIVDRRPSTPHPCSGESDHGFTEAS